MEASDPLDNVKAKIQDNDEDNDDEKAKTQDGTVSLLTAELPDFDNNSRDFLKDKLEISGDGTIKLVVKTASQARGNIFEDVVIRMKPNERMGDLRIRLWESLLKGGSYLAKVGFDKRLATYQK